MVWDNKPISREAGYLYFEVSPWYRDSPVYVKIRSKGNTLRGVRYWLNRITQWDCIGSVTHLK
jgi:hypothetical protein